MRIKEILDKQITSEVLPCLLMFYYKHHHKLCHKPTQKAELKEFANQK
jgi:hypothetical protein